MSEWISVKKKLPGDYYEGIVALWRLDNGEGEADIAFWDGQEFYIGGERMKPHEYSHWAPLPPDPPKDLLTTKGEPKW